MRTTQAANNPLLQEDETNCTPNTASGGLSRSVSSLGGEAVVTASGSISRFASEVLSPIATPTVWVHNRSYQYAS